MIGSYGVHKLYTYTSEKTSSSIKPLKTPTNLDKLTRTRIFTDNFITTQELLPLISYKNINGKATPYIEESRLETTLKPFLIGKLKKIFDSKGLNFEELSGRIYYEIDRLKISIFLTWKDNTFVTFFTNYDIFEIFFSPDLPNYQYNYLR